MYWLRYFEIFGFTQDNEDRRFAMLAAVICNISGKTLKRDVDADRFMPHYLGKPRAPEKSLEQQEMEMKAFAAKLKAVQGTK